MATAPIKFGTDGWRAIIAEDYTYANVRACAQALANYLQKANLASRGVLVGYDTRFSSELFAAACAEVLAANGIKVYLDSRASPTPVLSYSITALKTAGAIIITASHNPPEYNGFKIKTGDGTSAPPEATDQIEKAIPDIVARGAVKTITLADGIKSELIQSADTASIYEPHIARLMDLETLRKSKLKVVVDCMYGAGSGYFAALLRPGAIRVREINASRNPSFPGMTNPEPIARNLSALNRTILRTKADVGIATDGDADRLGIVDEKGVFVDPLQVFTLLAFYFLEVRKLKGAIIKTVTGSNMLYRLGEMYSVPVLETPVGFKYVAPLMMSENALIGGEESGGYGFRGHVGGRGGILAGLYFLDFMVRTGKTPSQLLALLYSKVGQHHYLRKDLHFAAADRDKILQRVSAVKTSPLPGQTLNRIDTKDGFKFVFSSGAWLLIRFSGTEPLVRIYAEAGNPREAERLVNAGKELAGL